MRYVLYRSDRIRHLTTGLAIMPIEPRDGWCDWPDDRCYNRPVTLPYRARAEAMWRADHLYDIVVVLGHNDDPTVAGRGSAVFFHLAGEDLAPTAGCVAVRKPDMLRLLRLCGPATRLAVPF
jgi:L,D-peptidoglycan transpeptidase YkuD (ErfK/YbiS/YcfS/YnhG family)